MADEINSTCFQCLNINYGRRLRQEAGIVINEFTFLIKIARLFLAINNGIITHQPLLNKKDVFANITCLKQVLALLQLFYAKQRPDDSFIIRRKRNVMSNGLEQNIHI